MSTVISSGGVRSMRRWRTRYLLGVAPVVVLAAVAAVVVLALTSTASVSADSVALARVSLPFGGGTIERLSVVGGREQKLITTRLSDGRIWPTVRLRPGERVTIHAVVRRPGWLSWLTGRTEHVRATMSTPATALVSQYLTVRSGNQLTLSFKRPVRLLSYAASGAAMSRHVLATPRSSFTLKAPSSAGTLAVAVAPRTWESPGTTFVTWFPAGAAASAVARPAPGARVKPDTPITLTFSKPVSQVLGSHMPAVSPRTSGTWHQLNAHTISFEPTGYGYGLGASISIPLPAGVHLVGGQSRGSDPVGHWSVAPGSTLRLQQMLASLGYLPLKFKSSEGRIKSLAGQMKAAVQPPSGKFTWRYANTPSALTSAWAPGSSGVITRGAIMAFENNEGMTTDGIASPAVWKALIQADLKHQRSTFGYTYVMVSEGSPETIHVWHNGKIVVSGLVNTGIAAAPTATGVYPVFEHVPVTTMSGYNPDGSYYSDPGIPWVSYFNGGDALHGFIRAGYGYPQSLGCVEMPFAEAHAVYPYTPIGTLVNVS